MNLGMRMTAAAWLCAAAGWAADWGALKPQGYVSDYAGVVDSASRSELEAYGAALEKSTGAHVSFVIIESLQKEPIHDVAQTILRAWNGGQMPAGDPALLLISLGERRDTLVVGKALQGILDPAAVEVVLAESRPALARKEYGLALMAAADEIGSRIAVARHKTMDIRLPRRAQRTMTDEIPWPLAIGGIPLFGLLVWLLRRPVRQPEETA